jgi:hypothetical protein
MADAPERPWYETVLELDPAKQRRLGYEHRALLLVTSLVGGLLSVGFCEALNSALPLLLVPLWWALQARLFDKLVLLAMRSDWSQFTLFLAGLVAWVAAGAALVAGVRGEYLSPHAHTGTVVTIKLAVAALLLAMLRNLSAAMQERFAAWTEPMARRRVPTPALLMLGLITWLAVSKHLAAERPVENASLLLVAAFLFAVMRPTRTRRLLALLAASLAGIETSGQGPIAVFITGLALLAAAESDGPQPPKYGPIAIELVVVMLGSIVVTHRFDPGAWAALAHAHTGPPPATSELVLDAGASLAGLTIAGHGLRWVTDRTRRLRLALLFLVALWSLVDGSAVVLLLSLLTIEAVPLTLRGDARERSLGLPFTAMALVTLLMVLRF